MARSKAYLFGGVEIRWSCDEALLAGVDDVPEQETFHFERGLTDFLTAALHGTTLIHPDIFAGKVGKTGATARSNGRSHGSRTPTDSSRPTATRSRRMMAARTKPACAPH